MEVRSVKMASAITGRRVIAWIQHATLPPLRLNLLVGRRIGNRDMDLIECMKMAADLADANGNDGVGKLLRQAVAAIEQLKCAGRKVVAARYDGDDWDALKNAIGELEDLVGRPRC